MDVWCEWILSQPRDVASEAGIQRHRRNDEPPCEGCRAARRRNRRAIRERQRLATYGTKPVEDTVGATTSDASKLAATTTVAGNVEALEELLDALRPSVLKLDPDPRLVREYRTAIADLSVARKAEARLAGAEDNTSAPVASLAARRRRRAEAAGA